MAQGTFDATAPNGLAWWTWLVAGVGAVILGPFTPIVALVWAVVYFMRHRDAATRARFLKRAGFLLVIAPCTR